MRNYSENIMKVVFLVAACVSIIAVVLICVFLFASGVPAIKEIGFSDFLLGDSWKPNQDLYGIFPMIIGSIYVTAGAIIVGVPIGLLCAVFMARYCPKGLYRIMKPAVDLLAGIPSIVYGFFGLMVIVPLVQDSLGGSGKCLLTSSVLLGIMILPTIISVSESNIRAVPEYYYEGALALGATKERSIFRVILPAAKDNTGNRKSHRRDHGSGNGLREPGHHAGKHNGWSEDSDSQHSFGNGLRFRTPQRSSHCYRGSAFRVHIDNKSFIYGIEKEG